MCRLLMLVLASLAGVGRAAAAETWQEVETEHFVVVSNAGEKSARRTAWELEQARAAFAQLWPWVKFSPGRSVLTVAVKDAATLKRWAPGYYDVKGGIDVVSGSVRAPWHTYLLLRTDSRPGQLEVTPNFNLYRGYLEVLLASSVERRLPVWLSNGLSEVFGNTFVQDREVHVGRPVPWQFRHFNTHARLPLRTILSAERGSPLLLVSDQREQFDAQSYVLVHALTFGGDGANIKKLNRFIQLWLAGRTHDEAWGEALGDVALLEKELTSYASRSVLNFGRLQADVNIDMAKPPARTLAGAAVAALQASVHVAMSRPGEARAAIDQARATEPKSAASFDAEGLLADLQNDAAGAVRAYGQATELGSTSAHSYYRAAQLAWTPSSDAATLAAQRKHLERAVALDTGHARAHAHLAEVLVRQAQAEAALPLVQRAVVLQPGDSYVHLVRARVLHALARPDDARQAIDVALQLADDERARQNARTFAQFLVDDAAHGARVAADSARRQGEEACRAGDGAACLRLVSEVEPDCVAGQASACAYAAWLLSAAKTDAAASARATDLWARACELGERSACVQLTWDLLRAAPDARDKAALHARLDGLCARDTFDACTGLAMLYLNADKGRPSARVRALLTRACDGGQRDACGALKSMR
jgi:tetratricopeptide (TPR) repeat protein